jgi:hypothetical protein
VRKARTTLHSETELSRETERGNLQTRTEAEGE